VCASSGFSGGTHVLTDVDAFITGGIYKENNKNIRTSLSYFD
jgi:hypothetical protein